MHCNHELSQYIQSLIGNKFLQDATKLKELLQYINDENVLSTLLKIKAHNKQKLADYIQKTMQISINPDSIFDIQIKRLHEYKRQQMNLLYIINLLLKIRQGYRPKTPITFILALKLHPHMSLPKISFMLFYVFKISSLKTLLLINIFKLS